MTRVTLGRLVRHTGIMPSTMHLLQQMSYAALLSILVAIIPAFVAAGYAIWPTESKLALMRPLSLASLFGGLAGLVAGLINGLLFAVSTTDPTASGVLLSGRALVALSESLVPLFVSFGSLTAAWLLVALGMRRISHGAPGL